MLCGWLHRPQLPTLRSSFGARTSGSVFCCTGKSFNFPPGQRIVFSFSQINLNIFYHSFIFLPLFSIFFLQPSIRVRLEFFSHFVLQLTTPQSVSVAAPKCPRHLERWLKLLVCVHPEVPSQLRRSGAPSQFNASARVDSSEASRLREGVSHRCSSTRIELRSNPSSKLSFRFGS